MLKLQPITHHTAKMPTYLVSYDLKKPGKDYSSLHGHLKSYANCAKPLESVWLIPTPMTAEVLRDTIRQHMDANDLLFVVNVTKREAAWVGMPENVSQWIINNM